MINIFLLKNTPEIFKHIDTNFTLLDGLLMLNVVNKEHINTVFALANPNISDNGIYYKMMLQLRQ